MDPRLVGTTAPNLRCRHSFAMPDSREQIRRPASVTGGKAPGKLVMPSVIVFIFGNNFFIFFYLHLPLFTFIDLD
jgi:hypothetical protein